jgi:nicotinic acid phosphoribosyltransferase
VLLADDAGREMMGAQAHEVVMSNKGGTQRTLTLLSSRLT